MEVLLYDDSGQISERLIEVIGVTINEFFFYQAASAKQLIKILTEKQPAAAVLHLAYANRSAAELIKIINAVSSKTDIIILFDVADEYNAALFNIRSGNYVFDTYKDFDKIPAVMREIMKKNPKH